MRRILIVHHEPKARRALRSRVEAAGHSVAEAGDATGAWSVFQRDRPGLIFLCPDLPGAAGPALFDRIRDAATDAVVLLFAEDEGTHAFGVRTLRAEEAARAAAALETLDAAGRAPFLAVKPRVLIVDDEPNVRASVERFLTIRGYETSAAADGAAGLAALAIRPPDLVLLDVDMPGIDGPRMLACLETLGRPVEVLMLTGDSRFPTMERCRDFGAVDYLLKPFELAYLDFTVYSRVISKLLR